MKYIANLLLTLFSVSAMACSQHATSPATVKSAADKADRKGMHYHQKPGAPITMTSAYTGSTSIGVTDTFDILLTAAAAGNLTVTIRSNDNLLNGGDLEMSKAVIAGDTISIPVSLVAVEEGKYYLKILANLSDNHQNRNRAFALAIYAGDWKKHSSIRNQKQPAVDGMILLPAEETIIMQ